MIVTIFNITSLQAFGHPLYIPPSSIYELYKFAMSYILRKIRGVRQPIEKGASIEYIDWLFDDIVTLLLYCRTINDNNLYETETTKFQCTLNKLFILDIACSFKGLTYSTFINCIWDDSVWPFICCFCKISLSPAHLIKYTCHDINKIVVFILILYKLRPINTSIRLIVLVLIFRYLLVTIKLIVLGTIFGHVLNELI